MSTLLAYISISDNKVKRSSLEVLSHLKEQGDANGHQTEAVIIDSEAQNYIDEVQKYGPSKIYTIEDPIFDDHRNQPLLKALNTVMDEVNPAVFGFASTESTKDILGALAAGRDAAVLSDVSSFELSDEGLKAMRPVMAAKILASTEAVADKMLV